MHIAEKYTSLARDAMASGDIIMAENYLQHAEHYNRIIMASQVQNGGDALGGFNGNGRFGPQDGYPRDFDQGGDEADGDEFGAPRGYQDQPRLYNQHQQPQPYIAQPQFPNGASANPQPAPQQALNGMSEQPAVQDAGFGEADRAPRRRRRRPIGEGQSQGRSFNGRSSNGNGMGHADLVNQINGFNDDTTE
jgi:hypothetical protein